MYDLTSFLSTISAGSASFVAILGGLIAQKVIEINNGRTAVEEEISLWAKCVRSCPTKIEENSKCFILILLGYRYYSALSECFNNYTRRKYDDKYDE